MLTLTEYLIANDMLVPDAANCDHCGNSLAPFALVEDGSDGWICGHCITDAARAAEPVFELGWDDVRGERNRLLTQCDWTQALDIADEVRAFWAPIRATLRDLPAVHETPALAMVALQALRAEHFQ